MGAVTDDPLSPWHRLQDGLQEEQPDSCGRHQQLGQQRAGRQQRVSPTVLQQELGERPPRAGVGQ